MKIGVTAIACITILLYSCQSYYNEQQKQVLSLTEKGMKRAIAQYTQMAKVMDTIPGQMPRSIKNNVLVTDTLHWWTSGFMPGTLWYCYEYSKDTLLLRLADKFTRRLESVQNYTGDHDIGFILNCSYGNGYRLTKNCDYTQVLMQGGKSLITRYDNTIGLIRSWDFGKWNYPVIIDNMMNLELLYWNSQYSHDDKFKKIADNHALRTIKNHFRPDMSTYHVVSYNNDGSVECCETAQGYANESTWARGQAWGLYGFTMCYRATQNPIYLNQAQKVADFLITHPRLPEDKIPYWDFDAPEIPNVLRDASAGAIMASALLELSQYTKPEKAKQYIDVAEKQIITLSSDEYLAEEGTNHFFLLKHGVGHMPEQNEIDAPLTYADYYYVEALMRYRQIMSKN